MTQTTRIIAHVSALRPMKDSVNWSAIPIGTPLVAGYVLPSHFAWPAAAWARFAGSVEVRITPTATTFGKGIQVLDVETGDATPGQVPSWCNLSRSVQQEPTVYTAYANWAACINACLTARVAVPQWWIADWNDQQNEPSITVNGVTYTAVAHQYADPATSGGDWDSSIVAPYWPGVDQGVDMAVLDDTSPGWLMEIARTAMMSGGKASTKAALTNAPVDEPNWILGAFNQVNAKLDSITGALSTDEAALLAAIKAIPTGGTVTDAQLATLTTALEAALPSYTVSIAPKI